jgi:hypothetical protein
MLYGTAEFRKNFYIELRQMTGIIFRAPRRISCNLCSRERNRKARSWVRCPLWVAGSTGRRNTCVKSLCRGFKSQGFAWPLIELACHFIQMSLRVHRQVGSLRKVLS